MVTAEPEVPEGGAVRAQLIGRHPLWREALFAQQLAHQLYRRAAVSAALTQHVEDLAFVTDRAPEYIRLPAIRTTISSRCQRSLGRGRRCRSRRAIIGRISEPSADALVGEVEPTLRKQLFDVAIAQGEAQVKPNRVLDHNRREPVPAIRNREHSSQPTAGR